MKTKEPYLELCPDLTLQEFRQLCFMAFIGDIHSPNTMELSYRKLFRISSQTYQAVLKKLKKNGWIEPSGAISTQHHLNILLCLRKHYQTWAVSFQRISFTKDTAADYLWNLTQKLVKNDFQGAAKLVRPYIGLGKKHFNLFRYIRQQVIGDARYMTLLNSDESLAMVDETLNEMFANDELGDDYLLPLAKIIPANHPRHQELMDEIAAYRFFLNGTYLPSTKPTMWSMAVEALRLMYQGDLTDAFDKFSDALKLSPKKSEVFPSPMLNYAYGILVCHLKNKYKENDTYQQHYNKIRQSSQIRFGEENVFVSCLLDYLDTDADSVQGIIRRKMNQLTDLRQDTLSLTWKYLALKFFGYDEPLPSQPLHSAKILQHELSAYLPFGPAAKKQLRETFGGEPLISLIRRKAPWEMMLDTLNDKVAQLKPQLVKRVVYYVEGMELNAIVEQVQREDGSWRDGIVLSRLLMEDPGYDSMNETDLAIAVKLGQRGAEKNAVNVIVPYLAGTGRLFIGYHYDGSGVPAVIHEEQPYLEFKGTGAFIEISSNVGFGTNGLIPRHVVRNDAKGEYTLIKINALQRDVLKRFLQMPRFPSSALVSLRRAIDSLQGIIEVRESILDISSIPAQPSPGLIAVRIVPEKTDYHVSVMATGLPDGTARFFPAEGEETVYDEVGGLTHRVQRNLSLELSNYNEMANYLEDTVKAEALNYTDFMVQSAEGLLLLLAFVFDHQNQYFVEWPEGKALKFKGDVKNANISVSVKSDEEWFTVVGEVTMGGQTYSLQELIAMCCNSDIKGFIKLNEEEYMRMSETLKKHIAAMNALSSKGKERRVSKYQVGALANMIEGFNSHTDGGYAAFMEKTKAAYALNPRMPRGMNAKLRDYQKEGFRWMCRLDAWGAGACLADDMGLGKTLQALTFLTYKATKGPSLVVMPKSVLLNWASEAERFAPRLNIIVLNKVTQRDSAIDQAKAGDVILCTYGLLVTEYSALTKKEWNVVCLDEAHQIKNRQTIASQTAMELKAASRIILTGTPLQNNLAELWNLFQFINPGLLGPWSRFRDNFVNEPVDRQHTLLLKDLTTPFILRRTKKEVLTELPEKIVDKYLIEMSDEERKMYEEMRRLAEVKFKKHKSRQEREESKLLDMNFFAELMRLRQAACDMRLVHEDWVEPSSKTTALMEILDSITQIPENNILIFSQFTSYLEIIKPELKQRQWEFLYLDGQTPMEKRQQIVEQFQQGQCRLFLSSLKAGGLGLNLTAANYVILLDP